MINEIRDFLVVQLFVYSETLIFFFYQRIKSEFLPLKLKFYERLVSILRKSEDLKRYKNQPYRLTESVQKKKT